MPYHSAAMFLKLACPKCARPFPLTEEDAASLYPQVWCFSCGTKIPLPLDGAQYLALVNKIDRDRKL